MSTLNNFGFNSRRKRNHTAHSPLPSNKEKASSAPILAFAAPAPPSFQPISKPQISSQVNKTNTKSKSKKQYLPKDPKQSTLLPFFATTTSSSSSSAAAPLPTNANSTVTQSHPSPVPMDTSLHATAQEQRTNSEDNEICLVKRHVTMNDLLPILMDAFGQYSMDMMQSGKQQQQQQSLVLLQVKPNKTLRTLQSETMDFTIENGNGDHLMPARQRRRRSCLEMNEDECQQTDDETETLRTAFTKSLSLVPVKKRLCGKASTSSSSSHRTISALFENGQERHLYALEDEFGCDGTQTHEEDNEIHTMRRCLSIGQVNSLLLDIANEYLAFENNTWCASYVGCG